MNVFHVELFVQLNIVANLFFACRFKMGYSCLFVQLNIVANLLYACRLQMGYFCLFVQLNIVVNLLFACRFKMGYFCFNLAIAPHTVQLNECVQSTLESIRQS